jgi:flagellar M-ring protein FliF
VLRLTTICSAAYVGGSSSMAALGGPLGPALTGPTSTPSQASAPLPPMIEDESMVNIAQIEGQMRASSLRRIGEIVEKHPEETLSIVRGWLVQESN